VLDEGLPGSVFSDDCGGFVPLLFSHAQSAAVNI